MEEGLESYASLRAPLLDPSSHSAKVLLSSLKKLIPRVCSPARSGHRHYYSFLRSLIEIIAPYIGERLDKEESSELLATLTDAFVAGAELPAFRVLVGGLDQNAFRAEVVVKILGVFVTRRRIEAVLEQAEKGMVEDVVGMIVHLGSRIWNTIYGTTNSEAWDEKTYVGIVADAVLDCGGGLIPGRVVEGLVIGGMGKHLVARWARRQDGVEKARYVIAMVGERAFQRLVRDMAEEGQTKMLENVFAKRAVRLATRIVLLNRPLLSRQAISAIVSAVCTARPDEVTGAVKAASLCWADADFAKHADVKLQRQVTRVVLNWLSYSPRRLVEEEGIEGTRGTVSLELANGVHNRLSHGDTRIRRYGMLVGESASRWAEDEKPLKFDRPVRDSPRSEIDVDDNSDAESDLSELARGERVRGGTANSKIPPTSEREQKPMRKLNSVRNGKDEGNKKTLEVLEAWTDGDESDDWTSLEAYSFSSDSDEDVPLPDARNSLKKDLSKIRESVASPFSVVQILTVLRKVAGGGDAAHAFKPEMVAATMRTLAVRAETAAPSLREYAPQLAKAVIGIDTQRFPDQCISEVSEARKSCLLKLTCLDIASVGEMLIENVICGGYAVLIKRSEAMSTLADAARTLSRKVEASIGREKDEPKLNQSGTVLRRLDKSLQASAREVKGIRNEFAPFAEDLFYGLANGIDAGGGADFLDLEHRDTSIVAQALVTLAVFVSCAGPQGLGRSEMCRSLIDLSMAWRRNSDAAIRRAVALALGSAAEAISPHELNDDHILRKAGGKGDAIEWLEAATEGGDPDGYVRHFASGALSKWASKITEFTES